MKRKTILFPFALAGLLVCAACATPVDPDPYTSPVPVPLYVNDPVFQATTRSEETTVGISAPIEKFSPYVAKVYTWDNVTYVDGYRIFSWQDVNARKDLVVNGHTQYLYWQGTVHVSQIPRLKHVCYWRKLFSVVLGSNTEYSESHTVTYGISTTQGQEFSVTIGMEISAWFATLSAEISQSFSYELTQSSEASTSKTFTAQGADGKSTVFTVWQLVDKFYLCDSDGNTLADNKDLLSDTIQLGVADYYFEESNESTFYLSTVQF